MYAESDAESMISGDFRRVETVLRYTSITFEPVRDSPKRLREFPKKSRLQNDSSLNLGIVLNNHYQQKANIFLVNQCRNLPGRLSPCHREPSHPCVLWRPFSLFNTRAVCQCEVRNRNCGKSLGACSEL